MVGRLAAVIPHEMDGRKTGREGVAVTMALALAASFGMDLALGDPRWLPHPVVLIGKLIAGLERVIRRLVPATPGWETAAGAVLALVVTVVSFGLPWLALVALWREWETAAWALQIWLIYQALATRSLRDAAGAVYAPLIRGDLAAARRSVGMIVGRETDRLDATGVARATVETVTENASDGVVAVLFYAALGGAPLAILYKAINTMDSMLGYKSARYRFFGRIPARLDDLANLVPARLTALTILIAAFLLRLDWRGAVRAYRRDRYAHASPNAGHPESAGAGALGVRLGGDAVYGGLTVRKPVLNAEARDATAGDILRANRLLYATALVSLCLCLALSAGISRWLEAASWT